MALETSATQFVFWCFSFTEAIDSLQKQKRHVVSKNTCVWQTKLLVMRLRVSFSSFSFCKRRRKVSGRSSWRFFSRLCGNKQKPSKLLWRSSVTAAYPAGHTRRNKKQSPNEAIEQPAPIGGRLLLSSVGKIPLSILSRLSDGRGFDHSPPRTPPLVFISSDGANNTRPLHMVESEGRSIKPLKPLTALAQPYICASILWITVIVRLFRLKSCTSVSTLPCSTPCTMCTYSKCADFNRVALSQIKQCRCTLIRNDVKMKLALASWRICESSNTLTSDLIS